MLREEDYPVLRARGRAPEGSPKRYRASVFNARSSDNPGSLVRTDLGGCGGRMFWSADQAKGVVVGAVWLVVLWYGVGGCMGAKAGEARPTRVWWQEASPEELAKKQEIRK